MDGLEELRALKTALATLPAAMPGVLKDSFNNLKPVVEDLVIEQLKKGQRGDGSFLPNYSPVSVNVFGKRPGPMTLHNEGDFYRGITLEVYDNGIEVVGTDMKTDMLQLRYGDDIIELQEASIETLETDYLELEVEEQIMKRLAT